MSNVVHSEREELVEELSLMHLFLKSHTNGALNLILSPLFLSWTSGMVC